MILHDTLGGTIDSFTAQMLVEMWFRDALKDTIEDAKRKFSEEQDERH